jgi:hypothetical protein
MGIPAMPEQEFKKYLDRWRDANRAFLEAVELDRLEMDIVCGTGGQLRQLRLRLPIRWKKSPSPPGPHLP